MNICHEQVRRATWSKDPERIYNISFWVQGEHRGKRFEERVRTHYGVVAEEELFCYTCPNNDGELTTEVSIIWPVFGDATETDIWPQLKYWWEYHFGPQRQKD